jgi:hypothetical protein
LTLRAHKAVGANADEVFTAIRLTFEQERDEFRVLLTKSDKQLHAARREAMEMVLNLQMLRVAS